MVRFAFFFAHPSHNFIFALLSIFFHGFPFHRPLPRLFFDVFRFALNVINYLLFLLEEYNFIYLLFHSIFRLLHNKF